MTAATPGLPSRRLAAKILGRVDNGSALDAVLEEEPVRRALGTLPANDRALVRAIVGTALRRRGQIRTALAARLARPLPSKAAGLIPILEVAAAQILFMEVPDHAAVSLAVDDAAADPLLAGWKGLVNALLRRLAESREEILTESVGPQRNTPDWLRERRILAYGEMTTAAIAAAEQVEPYLDVSVNTARGSADAWAATLGGVTLPTGTIRLVGGGAVEHRPGYAEGAWWVQDAAAALVPKLLGDVRGLRVADLCAAPGGKTAALVVAGAQVTAVDRAAGRNKRLAENLGRLGLAAEIVTADAGQWQPDALFDAVLLDAPCSATGTIRRHPDIAWLKSEADIAALAPAQARLLDHALTLVKPGGLLVYAVCSLEPEEGPEQISRVLAGAGAVSVERVPIASEEIGGLAECLTPEGDLRTLPTQLRHADARLSGIDGFFATRLRRVA